MRQLVILTFLLGCVTMAIHAQTFTEHLQQTPQGGKSVTVKQSKELDELVNHTDVSHDNRPATSTGKPETIAKKQQQTTTASSKSATPNKKTVEPVTHNASANTVKHETSVPEKAKTTAQTTTAEDDELDIPTVDMRKKVMRRSYKVNGYRVQVFAGGNSRTDKLKAQKAGDNVKMAFPDIPVYVHFYSPRWICRMGNFRTYEEANNVLKQVRELGYKQACIVSGKITVAY